ncbi:MAG: hypothetical protein L0Z49_13110 [Actinobacteria bacterium]|nr:hypothetical protein [Actinomycetota bacterium]MCI0545360.1 hypothetical protein [Actinomycetota bacterium]
MSNTDSSSGRGLRWPEWALLVVASFSWPLRVMAENVTGIPHPERLILMGSAVLLISAVGCRGLAGAGLDRRRAVMVVFMVTVLSMVGGRAVQILGEPVGWLALTGIVLLAVLAIVRLGQSVATWALTIALGVALASGVAISLYRSWVGYGEAELTPASAIQVQLTTTPDVFVVVLDGYPGIHERRLDAGQDQQGRSLTEAGLQVPVSAWSSYWTTDLSVSSLLQMGHPVVDAPRNGALTQTLQDVIGGRSRIVETLDAAGYETLMVESGWSGSDCGPRYDVCVSSPFLDEAMFFTLYDTILGPVVWQRLGHAFTTGTIHTMDWLRANAAAMSHDATPSFVFAHLVAPHPPFYLDEMCTLDVDPRGSGATFLLDGVDLETRELLFQRQVECIDRFMIELAGLIADDDVVVFTGDHGTDRRGQLEGSGGLSWSHDAIVERMNVMVAVRSSCPLGDEIMVPDLLSRALSCYARDGIPNVPNRMFLRGMSELSPSELETLLSMR